MSKDLISVISALPREAFEDAGYFRRETGRFFRGQPCYAMHAGHLQPGDQRCVRVGGRELILLLDPDRHVRAFPNRCVHKGERLLMPDDVTRSSMLRCPHHGWTYALDGRLLRGPGFDVSGRAKVPLLPPVGVSLQGGLVVVAAESSRDHDGHHPTADPFPDDATLTSAQVEVGVNWKLVLQAACETGWGLVLPNASVLEGKGWTMILRWEPLGPQETQLVLERCRTPSAADVPALDMTDEVTAAATVLHDTHRGGTGRTELVKTMQDLESALLNAMEDRRDYFLPDW